MSAAFTVGQSRGSIAVPTTGLPRVAAAAPSTSVVIRIPDENNRPMVTIHPDGRIEYGETYEPDTAARAFWEAVERLAPSPAERQFGKPLAARIDAELARGRQAEALLRSALAQYEAVAWGQVDGRALRELAAKTRAFLSGGSS